MPWFNRNDCALVQQERLCPGSTGTTVPWWRGRAVEGFRCGIGERLWRGLGVLMGKGGGLVLDAVSGKGG